MIDKDLETERAKIDAEIAELQKRRDEVLAKEKERREKRMALIGECVSKMMEADTELKSRVEAQLNLMVTGKRNRTLLGLGEIVKQPPV